MTWIGIKVQHADGRTGTIRRDIEGYAHRSLRLDMDDPDQAPEWVQLNVDGPDSGATGWSWQTGAGEWRILGDHNTEALRERSPG